MNRDIILYSDFNCPFCYALGERLLAAKAAHTIEWRGVQHAPYLPIPMANAGAALAAELTGEVRAIHQLAPELAIALPRGKPNSGPAIRAVAAALQINSFGAHALKDALYREFWLRGTDISDASVLQALAHAAGLSDEGNISGTAKAAEWQHAWEASGLGGVPAMVRGDGEIL
ncbi:MAG: DsbA family protein, partial [Gammaproteobacteria bacterium]